MALAAPHQPRRRVDAGPSRAAGRGPSISAAPSRPTRRLVWRRRRGSMRPLPRRRGQGRVAGARSLVKATQAPNRRPANRRVPTTPSSRQWSLVARVPRSSHQGTDRGCTDRRGLAAEFGVFVVLAKSCVADLLLLERAIGLRPGSRGPGRAGGPGRWRRPRTLHGLATRKFPGRWRRGPGLREPARVGRGADGDRRISGASIPARPTACRGVRARQRAGGAHSSRGAPKAGGRSPGTG